MTSLGQKVINLSSYIYLPVPWRKVYQILLLFFTCQLSTQVWITHASLTSNHNNAASTKVCLNLLNYILCMMTYYLSYQSYPSICLRFSFPIVKLFAYFWSFQRSRNDGESINVTWALTFPHMKCWQCQNIFPIFLITHAAVAENHILSATYHLSYFCAYNYVTNLVLIITFYF